MNCGPRENRLLGESWRSFGSFVSPSAFRWITTFGIIISIQLVIHSSLFGAQGMWRLFVRHLPRVMKSVAASHEVIYEAGFAVKDFLNTP